MTPIQSPTQREYDTLKGILDALAADGVPPTRGRIAQHMGTDTYGIGRPLTGLRAKGYASPAYDGGPWVPLRGLDGLPVRLVCRVEVTP